MYRTRRSRWLAPTLALAATLASRPGIARAAAAAVAPSAVADSAYAHHDWAGAEAGYAALVKRTPASPRFWYRLGFSRQSQGRFLPAAEAYRRADALGVPPSYARYNLACALARAGEPDSTLAVLQRLMDSGYGDTAQLQADSDLAVARSDARFGAILERAKHNAQPCAYQPESRQFDFWIGDWDVTQNIPGGGPAGESHVELILNQCVIFENWKGRLGSSGKSFNAWNADLACWQQNWMDDRGDVTNYGDGQFRDGALQYHAEKKDAAGHWQKHRLTFFPIDADHVRQFGESSTDGGATWTPSYDLLYTRRR